MTEYIIRVFVEGGGFVDITCNGNADYAGKTAFLEKNFPHLKWKELRK